jgi:hypothetical protein
MRVAPCNEFHSSMHAFLQEIKFLFNMYLLVHDASCKLLTVGRYPKGEICFDRSVRTIKKKLENILLLFNLETKTSAIRFREYLPTTIRLFRQFYNLRLGEWILTTDYLVTQVKCQLN